MKVWASQVEGQFSIIENMLGSYTAHTLLCFFLLMHRSYLYLCLAAFIHFVGVGRLNGGRTAVRKFWGELFWGPRGTPGGPRGTQGAHRGNDLNFWEILANPRKSYLYMDFLRYGWAFEG